MAIKGTELAGVPVSTDSTAPSLVWPPSDEDLDDWHVIPLNRPNADAPAAGTTSNGGTAGPATGKTGKTDAPGTAATAPRKPLPAWLANHRAAKSGGGSTTGTIGAPTLNLAPRAMPPGLSGSAIRAVTPSPLEDTARLPGETTTAISSIRRPQAQASAESATALDPAAAAQRPAARPVAAFPSEQRRPVAVARPAPSPWNGAARRTAIVVLALLAAGQAAYIGARLLVTPDATATSVLTVDSVPDGADVFIDGERRGVTPFKVELTAGSHSLQLRKNGRTRTIPLVLAAGVQASQYVELGASGPAGSAAASASGPSSGPSSGSSSAPPSAPSAAAPRPAAPSPASPVPADGIAAPAAADATAAPPGSSRGWVVIESGLNLRVLRNGELLGSSEEGRLALSAGRHELELVNDAVGYRAVMTVQVPPGRAVPVPVELPQSVINITSTPSARVWVDGREIGSTPVAQLALPVGQHSVRFEHPQYGERSMTVLVRVGVTAQASVDFTR